MLTTTICDDTITPTYGCGIEDKPQTLFHGAKFAEYKLVKNHDKHLQQCKVCRPNNTVDDADMNDVIDFLAAIFSKPLFNTVDDADIDECHRLSRRHLLQTTNRK